MRGDLSPGLQMAQACHAAIEYTFTHPDSAFAWWKKSNNIVILTVPTEAALKDLHRRAGQVMRCVPFTEPDLNDDWTAVAFTPGETASELLSGLPLAGKELVMSG